MTKMAERGDDLCGSVTPDLSMDLTPSHLRALSGGSTQKVGAIPLRRLTDTSTYASAPDGGTCTVLDGVTVAVPYSSPESSPSRISALSVDTAVRKPCKKCGRPKDRAVRGAHLCSECYKKTLPKPCAKCGGPKGPGKGNRLCPSCQPLAVNAPRPCPKCGSRAPKQRGQHLCNDCNSFVPEMNERRRKARRALTRQPCLGCNRPKGPGCGRKFCESCRAKAEKPFRKCERCDKEVRTGKWNRLCFECKAEARKKNHARMLEYGKIYRAANPRKTRERDRLYNARKNVQKKKAAKQRSGRGNSLPGPPLAKAIRAIAYKEATNGLGYHSENDTFGRVAAICVRAGISDRAVRRWEGGEGVSITKADLVCQRLGLEWWNVWAMPPDMSGRYGNPRDIDIYIRRVEDALAAKRAFEG